MTLQSDQTTPMISDELKGFLQGLAKAEVVALDTETTGLKIKTTDYLQGLSLAYRLGGMVFTAYLPFQHESGNLPMEIVPNLFHILKGKRVIFFNRKFDFHSLFTLYPAFQLNDTVDISLLAHFINEERPYQKNLNNVGMMYVKKGKTGKDEIDKFTEALGWGNVPPHLMDAYARGDAELTLELYEKLWPMFQKKFGDKADELINWEDRMNLALYNMEHRGIHVDQKFCRQYEGIANIEMDNVVDELGFVPSKTKDLSQFLFDELKLPVLKRSEKTGKPSLDKAVMEDYERMLEVRAEDNTRVRLVLDYRGWQKAASTFYAPFQFLADEEGRIHCNYNQNGTVTGRLSASEPNLQQIPRTSNKAWNGRIRSAFRASEGYDLVGYDYSQLEFRLAAAYGQEEWLIEEFAKEDADPFTVLAERIGTDRYTAKTFTYAMIYGAGKDKIAATLKRTVTDIEDPYNAFLATIPGIIKAKSVAQAKAKSRGYIRYWTGRRRHFPDPSRSYKAFNSLLQGGGAEVVKRVLVLCNENVCDDNCRLLLQVHDELVFEIRQGMEDVYGPRIIDTMQSLPTNYFGVNFAVAGKKWGE